MIKKTKRVESVIIQSRLFVFFSLLTGRLQYVLISFAIEYKKKYWTSLGLNSITWPGLFTSKTVRKHRKFVSDHMDFIICILSFVICHPHFSILILSSAFCHPHFFIRILPSAFYHIILIFVFFLYQCLDLTLNLFLSFLHLLTHI